MTTTKYMTMEEMLGTGQHLSQAGKFSKGILIRVSEHCSLMKRPTANTNVMYKLMILNLLSVSPIIPSGSQLNKSYKNGSVKARTPSTLNTPIDAPVSLPDNPTRKGMARLLGLIKATVHKLTRTDKTKHDRNKAKEGSARHQILMDRKLKQTKHQL